MKQGDQIQDRYVLEEGLGRGGMAEVWRALDRNLERPVAIKFLAPQLTLDPAFLVRFFSEAQSVAGLSHPNVVSVLDFGEHEGSPYLVMEHVPGGAVTELTGDPLQPDRAAEVVRDAALGAGAAHERGVIHRDIKPGNILLCEDGRAKIADFGIASSAFSEKLTATGQVIGSPHYIAPEQAAGKGSVPGSDVYALGVVLYELLTGHPPFDADNATAIAIAHVDREPEPPSKSVPDLDPGLEAVVLRALTKDPANRFRNGNELAHALEEVVPALGGVALGTVPPAAAATLTAEDTAPREVVEEEPLTPAARRSAVLVAAAVVLALLAVGAWATSRDTEPGRESVASASEGESKKAPRPKATESEGYGSDYVDDTSAPSPTPSPSESQDDKDEKEEVVAERESDSGGHIYRSGDNEMPEEQPTEEPSPTESPTPEEEASTEPTPEPSEADDEEEESSEGDEEAPE